MAYRYDEDLEFLQYMSSEELESFADVLIRDPKDGEKRWTEEITKSGNYIRYGKDYAKYWKDLAEEFQKFGGNTFANMARGHGVLYREILCDVCDKQKVSYNKGTPTQQIEIYLLQKILDDIFEKLNEEQIKELADELGIDHINIKTQGFVAASMLTFRLGGFASYQLTLRMINLVWKFLFGHGLKLATNATIARILSIATGPIGWAITGVWTAWDIASPAFRVTFPAVLQIIALRQIYMNKDLEKQNNNPDLLKI
ncbi:DUF3944 domain-containing protein [Helicobacter sp. faydin-H20]|uniref:DUF3944 domain-containing protein n=1 Tax=Helicobacter anatolicus TaxID=2905874 RepID=UPI001E399B0F|nr:DUF3944 domain-containing protein [Helicobacter anatolicus]MCE3037365.1 DUF3944 domain-containing protein [Helicobacter anatolicus]